MRGRIIHGVRRRAGRSLLLLPVLGALAVQPAQAVQPHSALVASPTSVTVNVGETSGAINVHLDDNCINPLGNGQTYVIQAGSLSLVTVSPQTSSPLHCGDSANFTVTGVSEGTGSLTFTPQTKAQGLNNKLDPVSITVTVVCPTGTGTCGTVTPPTGDHRPAAPALTNGWLALDSAFATACQGAFGPAKNWRGKLLSTVAQLPGVEANTKWSYPTAGDWIDHVQSLVYPLCGATIPTV